MWEMLKLKLLERLIKSGAIKKKQMAKKQNEIEQMITTLEKQLSSVSLDDPQKQSLWTQLETNKQELERIVKYQIKDAILRSKFRWYFNEGEKNTKYFLNLEKRDCRQATITQLRTNDQKYISADKEILNECKTFCKDLYTSKAGEEDIEAFPFPLSPEEKTLTAEERAFCEGLINEKER